MCVLTASTIANLFDFTPKANLRTQPRCPLLFDTSVGDIQRNLDATHLQELIAYQKDHHAKAGCFSFPTSLVVAEHKGRFALVDGQHRVEAICHLSKLYPEQVMQDTKVPVTVLQLDSVEEYDARFVEVNQNMPVKVHMHTEQWKHALKPIDAHFRNHYAAYLRTTDSPRVPHVNLENLLEYIRSRNIRWGRGGLTPKAFLEEMESLNTWYSIHWTTAIKPKIMKLVRSWAPECKAKQPDRPLMLGMYRKFEWVDRVLVRLLEPNRYPSYEIMTHVPVSYRARIPVSAKKKVWAKRNDSSRIEGKCYVCSEPIHYEDMQCGHVVSVFDGGETTVDNMEPICGKCNRDMGVRHLETYRAEVRAACGVQE